MNSPGSLTSSLILAHSGPFRLNIVPKLQLHRTELFTCTSSSTVPHAMAAEASGRGAGAPRVSPGKPGPLTPLQAAAEALQKVNETEVRP